MSHTWLPGGAITKRIISAHCTLPTQDRLSLLRVLPGGAEPGFRWNERALNLLEQLGLAQKWRHKLTTLPTRCATR